MEPVRQCEKSVPRRYLLDLGRCCRMTSLRDPRLRPRRLQWSVGVAEQTIGIDERVIEEHRSRFLRQFPGLQP